MELGVGVDRHIQSVLASWWSGLCRMRTFSPFGNLLGDQTRRDNIIVLLFVRYPSSTTYAGTWLHDDCGCMIISIVVRESGEGELCKFESGLGSQYVS